MAKTSSFTRLSPPLMHVFRASHAAKDAKMHVDVRNADGERILAGRRLKIRQVITESMVRQEVARDLDALLNTIALEATVDMTDAPDVRKSILNFGLPDVSPISIDEEAVDRIPDAIREAILHFEPRLAPDSLHVERDRTVDTAELKVRFLVRAELVCDPVHVPVEFIADIVDAGKIVINRL